MSHRYALSAFVALAAALQLSAQALPDNKVALSAQNQKRIDASLEKAQAKQLVQSAFGKLVDDYFAQTFKAHPDFATESGIHDYDDKIPSCSAQDVQSRIAELQQFRQRFEAVNPEDLERDAQIDRKILIANAGSELLELQSIQNWKHNPDSYSSMISANIFSLMKRDFAPLAERLRCVIAREKAVPEILENARANIEGAPKILTEIALEQLPDIVNFFETAVPQAFLAVKDAKLKEEFTATNDETIRQLKIYQTFLHDEVLPKATASFAIGKENYQKKLLYDEMVDEPVDSLLAKGYEELHKLQKEFVQTAKRIDPSKSAAQVYLSISSEHPQPDELLAAVQAVLSDLRQKCLVYVSIPSEDKLQVQETPPFMRATTFASMDAPGPFETKAKEAYYQVTLPEKSWDAKRTEEHMRFFCTLDLINTSVHEAYPGHYVQGLWAKLAPSKTRKLLACGTATEGWAHYCEQMMADSQPDNLKLKMVQLHDALLRVCRYIVGIEMHTGGMTMEAAKQFFITQGYQEPANADRETKRGTGDPTYLVYTLGKLQIQALRDDYKKMKGDKYNLKQFNDDFLAQGYVPIKLMRELLLKPQVDKPGGNFHRS